MKRVAYTLGVLLLAGLLMAQVGVTIGDITGITRLPAIDAVAADDEIAIADTSGGDMNRATIAQLTTAADTNANTICSGTGNYLDGEGNCDALVTDTDTNANTECSGTTTYLDGEGNCDTIAQSETMVYSFFPGNFGPYTHVGVGSPTLATDTGTNPGNSYVIQHYAYDKTTDECQGVMFVMPETVDTSRDVRFRIYAYPATDPGAAENIRWEVRELSRPHQSDWDAALAGHGQTSPALVTSQDSLVETEWTVTLVTLGWNAEEQVVAVLCRDADHGDDDLDQDALMTSFTIEIPIN
jgi:hypothetical protein